MKRIQVFPKGAVESVEEFNQKVPIGENAFL